MSDIFISHVEEDAAVVLEIARLLEASGYSTWYYERDSVPGVSYLEQVDEAIQRSSAVVVLISLDSMGSWQVDKEVERAHECGKKFMPILRGVKHVEFQARKRGWRMALGTATSVVIPPDGVATIMPRVILGLQQMGITPGGASPIQAGPIQKTRESAAGSDLLAAGDQHLDRKEYEQAIDLFSRAIALSPSSASAFCRRGTAILEKYNSDFDVAVQRGLDIDERPLDKAIADFTEAIRLDAGKAEAFSGRALSHLRKRKFKDAIADFDEVLRVTPGNAMTYCKKGEALFSDGEYRRAAAHFTEALRIDPGYVEAYQNRARLHRLDKKFDLVVADCTEAIKISPENADLYWTRAEAYVKLEEYDRAIADHSEARRLNPVLLGDVSRANAYLAKKDYDHAIADYTEVISYHMSLEKEKPGLRLSTPPIAFMNRGVAYLEKRQYDPAIADFTRAIDALSSYWEAYEKRGDAFAAKGETSKAAADHATARDLKARRGY
jgi:tetratricopeptide (TPR) repeat protein